MRGVDQAHLPERLRKRDGQVVPFSPRRITEAVARAQSAVGIEDPALPLEVAELVVMTLISRAQAAEAGAAPLASVEEVQDLVEEALVGLGRTKVAKAYILYRDRRGRARQALVVSDPPSKRKGTPEVRGAEGAQDWQASRIAAALVRESSLTRQVADEVSRRVEKTVLSLGMSRVSTGLVRAFVDQELQVMGLFDATRASEPLGLARPDLRALLMAPLEDRRATEDRHAAPPASCERRVSGALLTRWAAEDVLGEDLAEAHHRGEVLALGLERPHLPLVRSISAAGLGVGSGGESGFARSLPILVTLLEGSAQGLVLEGFSDLIGPARRGARQGGDEERVGEALAALGAIGQASGRRLDLVHPGGRGPRPLMRLLTGLVGGLALGHGLPRLFLGYDEMSAALTEEPGLAEGIDALIATGRLVPVWGGPNQRFAGPALARRSREKGPLTLCAGVALDLVRIARRAGPWNEEGFLGGLVTEVNRGLEAIKRLAQAQSEFGPNLPGGRRIHAIVPVGLSDALRILGDGIVRPDQGARALGVLRESAQAQGERMGLMVEVSTLLSGPASEVLARREAGRPRPSQEALFGERPLPESERVESYHRGLDLGDGMAAGDPVEHGCALAAVTSTLPSGALWPLADPAVSHRSGLSCLATWQAFAEERERLLVPHPAPRTEEPILATQPLFDAAPVDSATESSVQSSTEASKS